MELVTADTAYEYENFISTHLKGHFMQSAKWAEVKDNWKWEGVIVRGEDKKIKGALSVLIRKLPGLPLTLMYAPRGPVCDPHDKETFRALLSGAKKLARKHKSYILKLDPDIKAEDKEFLAICKELGLSLSKPGKNFEGIQPRFVFRLYLQGRGEEEMMASFHSKTRYNIRVAQKKGVTVEIKGKECLADFHRIMLETGLRDHFMIRSQGYFEKMLDALGEDARLYMAYFEGKPVAGTIAVHYGDKVWYLYGASSNEYRNVMPNYLLQWEMIRWAVDTHCTLYDFRGVSGDLDESNPLYGLYRFKKGFNGEFTEFIGEANMVFSPFVNFCVSHGERVFRVLRKYVFMLKNK